MSVKLDKRLSTRVAEAFGPQFTHPMADRAALKARVLAQARTIHQPGLYDINVSSAYRGIDGVVTLSIRNRKTGQEVASFWEYGAWNNWARRFLPGHHVMRDVAMSTKVMAVL